MSDESALWRYLLARTDWQALGSCYDNIDVEKATRSLLEASSEEQALQHYRALDNTVVVQGAVFPAALPLVDVLLAALTTRLHDASKVRVLELLLDIGRGEAHPLVDQALGPQCAAAVAQGKWLFVRLVDDDETDEVMEAAIDVLTVLFPDDPAANWWTDLMRKRLFTD